MLSLYSEIFVGFQPNNVKVAIILAKLLCVKISSVSIKDSLEAHPDFPSLLSISDSLRINGINNECGELSEERLVSIPFPFITQIQTKNNKVLLTTVKEISGEVVKYYDPEKSQWVSRSTSVFLEKCTKVVLIPNIKDSIKSKSDNLVVSNERRKLFEWTVAMMLLPVLGFFYLTFHFFQLARFDAFPVIFVISTLLGWSTSTLLVSFEIDEFNPTLRQICSLGKKTSCEAVLKSKGSKIAGISWSIIGFSYFSGQLLFILIQGINNSETTSLLAWLNALTIPYVLYSILYQYKIIKQWCVLCVVVQIVIIIQLIACFGAGWHTVLPNFDKGIDLLVHIAIAFCLPVVLAPIIVGLIQRAKEAAYFRRELIRFKSKPEIFETQLLKQKIAHSDPAGLGITLGNADGPYKIIKVCNPYCRPCAKAHSVVDELLELHDDLQVQIIFTATNNQSDKRTPIVKHFLSLNQTTSQSIVKHALNDWYQSEHKDYVSFKNRFPSLSDLNNEADNVEKMSSWCRNIGIQSTPTFFVLIPNRKGEVSEYRQLPHSYSITDLKYLMINLTT